MALIIYALWGSPTPNQPGVVELIIGVFLLLSLTLSGAFQEIVTRLMHRTDKWFLSLLAVFIYGLTITLIGAILNAAPPALIIRDVIAFVFFCAPLFFFSFIKFNKSRQDFFLGLILVIGFIFSLRVLLPTMPLLKSSTELLYLANSPLVLFTSLFLISRSMQSLFQSISLRSAVIFILGAILFVMTLMAMLVDTQRATVAALILSFIFLSTLALIKAPFKAMIPLIIIMVLIAAFDPVINDVIDQYHKHLYFLHLMR